MEWVLNGKGSKIAIIDDLKEEYTSKFKSVDLLFRKMEIYPKSKKSFDSYFKLSEKQRNVVDQIIDCLLEK
ncbi:hypothetical protein LEP1GSC187_2815 [Leptospira santarosai str. ZUN179]|uniref:Uncharacterized protein n=2 Tax=Leptospira TaxID=171 RepID=M6UMK1_9LEPT|nr:hypothetical protein LEP1GSC187_2815 [Leptospira santarosai str. ZUN179]